MSLAETINKDLISAMKAKESLKADTLRMAKAAITNFAIEKKKDRPSDGDCQEVIQKLVKQRRDSVESYEKAGRKELADKEKTEITYLQAYLPKQLSDEELTALVQESIHAVGAKTKADMGKIMKDLMPKVKGKADGKKVQSLASSLLK